MAGADRAARALHCPEAMHHTYRLRVALLTSLGFLPAACIGGRAADTGDETPGPGIGPGTTLTACDDTPLFVNVPVPGIRDGLEPGNIDTGLVEDCTGLIHRPTPVACASQLPRPMPPADAGAAVSQLEYLSGASPEDLWYAECTEDSACTDRPFGYCATGYGGKGGLTAQCSYGCQSDADCDPGSLCECGDPIGHCVQSTCQSDTDCGGDSKCGLWVGESICSSAPRGFACTTDDDACVTAADCSGFATCEVVNGNRQCKPASGLICGRPFLVQGEARLATLVASDDWCRSVPASPLQLGPAERARAGQHWAEAALMEHASIAAFARFTLQLMHLGAPHALVEASQRAMLDETEHARLCFGLAQRYLAAHAGPGPLPLGDALLDIHLDSIVRMTFLEGCVGETIAALEAHAARDGALDPDVQRGLERIAGDELRHAELGWRFVSWALEQNPGAVRALLAEEITRLERELTQPRALSTGALGVPAHGVLAGDERARVRRSALAEVVLPCARALLGCTALDQTVPECSDPGRFRVAPEHSLQPSA